VNPLPPLLVAAAALGIVGGAARADEPVDDPRLGPPISVRALDPDGFGPVDAVGDLRDGMVVRVTATGFEPNSDGRARQCLGPHTSDDAGATERPCTASVPVRFDDHGTARTLFLFAASIPGAGSCPSTGAWCELEVVGADGRRAVVRTLFGVAPPDPARLTASPSRGVLEGETIDVAVRDAEPGQHLVAALCAPPALDVASCGAPGPTAAIVADAAGSGTAHLIVRAGPVGTAGSRCSEHDPCRVAVLVDGQARGTPALLTFASGPGASYEERRLAIGLLLAAACTFGAVHIGRTTSWARPDEPYEERAEPARRT
jgi:hypothetical protein